MYSLNDTLRCVSTFGNLRIEAYLQLPAAYRSLSRPSSALDAKAFTLCSSSLELSFCFSALVLFVLLELLEFHKQIILVVNSSVKRFYPFALESFFHLAGKLYFTQIGKTYNFSC